MVELDAASQTALATHSTLRCLLDSKYVGGRHSEHAISWAKDSTQQFIIALASATGSESRQFTLQLNSILLARKRAYICFDIYAEGCDEATIARIDSSCRQPIHHVLNRANMFHVQRKPSIDSYVAERYRFLRNVDLGPRPYFSDEINPSLYDMGSRVEAPLDQSASNEDDHDAPAVTNGQPEIYDGVRTIPDSDLQRSG